MPNTSANEVPRLKLGQGRKGPEPSGCFNTGVAPVILRSRLADRYRVGRELDVEEAGKVLWRRWITSAKGGTHANTTTRQD